MSNQRQLNTYRVLRYVVAGCGWLVIFLEWIRVSRHTPASEQVTLVLLLIPSLLLIHAGATAWIAHSKRIAARGKRGLVTRYTSPEFSQDHLGRQLIVDDGWRVEREIHISVHEDSKSYSSLTESAE